MSRASASVFDFDDALFAVRPGSRFGDLARALKIKRLVQFSDRVCAGNDFLADWASQFSRDVHVLPTCVEPDDYVRKTQFELRDPPQCVWLGSPSTMRYLEPLTPVLTALNRELGLRLTVIGGAGKSAIENYPFVDARPWKPGVMDLSEFDLAISPLADGTWERGKCAYKILQYGASQVPVIASPVGVNGVVLSGGRGLTATTDAEWLETVRFMLDMSGEGRRVMAERLMQEVSESFSFQANAESWKRLVEV